MAVDSFERGFMATIDFIFSQRVFAAFVAVDSSERGVSATIDFTLSQRVFFEASLDLTVDSSSRHEYPTGLSS